MTEPRGKLLWVVGAAIWLVTGAWGQTAVDLRTQSRSVDFTGAAFTRPVKVGVSLPGSCTLGDLFFKSDAPAGSNLYACVAPSLWTALVSGGGSSVSSAHQLVDFAPSNTPNLLTLSCTQCRYRIGEKVFTFAGAMTAGGLSGSGATTTVFVYLDKSGSPKFGYDGGVVSSVSLSGLTGQSGVLQIPGDAIPLAQCTVASNQFTSCTDLRSIYSRTVTEGGTGVVVLHNSSTGVSTISVNPAVIGLLGGPNTWTGNNDFRGAAHTSPVKTGLVAERPAACSVGELYFATDGTAGKNLHFCTAVNTWTVTP